MRLNRRDKIVIKRTSSRIEAYDNEGAVRRARFLSSHLVMQKSIATVVAIWEESYLQASVERLCQESTVMLAASDLLCMNCGYTSARQPDPTVTRF